MDRLESPPVDTSAIGIVGRDPRQDADGEDARRGGSTSRDPFVRLESNVRSYSRSFPTVFETANRSRLRDSDGREYLDFFAAAGSLNYGHNHPALKRALIDHIDGDGITQSLDMETCAKSAFLCTFDEHILRPRSLRYKVQFTGPTGANGVEAALKLARKATGRSGIVSFTNAFHGVSLGALSVSANPFYRTMPGQMPGPVTFMPYDGFLGPAVDTVDYLEEHLKRPGSGLPTPAAFIVETVQGEGGVNVASCDWLRRLAGVAHRHGILLIVDDVQMGCGRTGAFFSFEEAELEPDIVVLSKSLSGYGLPFSVLLLKSEIDVWEPGEHNGTFRGNNLAFVTAAAAIKTFWTSDHFQRHIGQVGALLSGGLREIASRHGGGSDGGAIRVRGRGMVQGLDFGDASLARQVARHAFQRGLLVETAGADGATVKSLPPLTTTEEDIAAGVAILESAVGAAMTG